MLYVLIKQRITVPRFGFVRFESQKKTVQKAWISVGIGVLFVAFFLTLNVFVSRRPASPEAQAWIQRYHMVPLSAMLFGLPTLAAALFLGLKRFYLYMFLAVGLPLLGALMNIETYIPIVTTGAIMIAFGAFLLITFLQKYPLNAEGEDASG
jgi:hypothetical protein